MKSPLRAQRVVALLVALCVGAIVAVAALLIVEQRRGAVAGATALAGRVARSAEASLNRTLLDIDLRLAGISRLPALQPDDDRPQTAQSVSSLLEAAVERTLLVTGFSVVDEDCRPVAASTEAVMRIGSGLRAGFCREVLARPAVQLAISEPVTSAATGEQVLYFARPLRPGRPRDAAGGAVGDDPGRPGAPQGAAPRWIAVAEMPLLQVSVILSQALDIPGLSITLERDDGLLLSSVPPNDPRVGTRLDPPLDPASADSAPRFLPARLGRGEAIVAVRPTIYRSPLIAVGISEEAIALDAAAGRAPVVLTATLLSAAAIFVGLLACGHLRRNAAAAEEIANAQAMLDQALASMADGFLLCDAEDRVVRWNDRYLELLPHQRGVIAPGVHITRLIEQAARTLHPEANDAQRQAWIARRLEQRQRPEREYELRMPDGHIIQGIARRTATGGTVTVMRDVTQARESAEELERARAAAEAANEAKTRFLATMSHEIRTPLNGVLGMNGLLLETRLDDDQRHYAETVRSSGEALLSVINDILDFSRLQAGRMSLEIAPFCASVLIDAVVSLLGVSANAKGLTIRADLSEDLPPWLDGDAGRLRQVLFNLIGNAVKFTHTGGIVVEARTRPLEPGRVELEIVVRDTGIGISPELLPRLFDRFSQADNSTARRYGGSGLGLAITREILELMGGQVTVESRVGEGSAFRVAVPLALADAPVAAPPVVTSGATATPSGRPLRILVAEDNIVNQKLIRAMLERMGHAVDLVEDGGAAVRQVQAKPYDVVLMDIQMPGMDGEAATRAIRALPGAVSKIPIVALTANAMAGHREMYLDAGMDDHIAKPVDRALLDRVLQRVTAPDGATA
ncbi:MAG: hypothetical protein RIS35_994 [Pseudomonadota bacterium]|jgi:signal transduction histidine kinase/ActR/RegA family two-component response regulator